MTLPHANQPATNQPATNQPATNQPATNQPATNRATSSRPRSLAHERHDYIANTIQDTGSVRVVDLAVSLGVSEMTIRRDLETMEEAGTVVKVHGGAMVIFDQRGNEPTFERKSSLCASEKKQIAREAAALCPPGAAIGITGGTTTAALALQIGHVEGLTVVTNNLAVARALDQHGVASQTVILTGGEQTPSQALVGPVAVNSLRSFHLDTVFMGVHGMHSSAGFTTPNLAEAETNRAFISSTSRVAVLADHSKWGVTGLATIANFDEVTDLITDAGLEQDTIDELDRSIERVVIATGGTSKL